MLRIRLLKIHFILIVVIASLLVFSGCAKKYIITFDPSGGIFLENESYVRQKTKDGSDLELPKVKREHYTFIGWDMPQEYIDDTVVTAIWEPEVYSITFDANGGSIVSGDTVQSVIYDEAATPPVVTRTDYIHIGWDCNYDHISGDAVIKAKWAKEILHISFDLSGGSLVRGELTQAVRYGSIITPPVSERVGYNFTGWDCELSEITDDTVVTAVWDIKKFNVTFDLRGGTDAKALPSQTVEYGKAAVLPSPVKSGYVFIGWSSNTDFVTSDMNVSAMYALEKIHIDFNLAGGELLSGSTTADLSYGSKISAPVVSREGYDFLGWGVDLSSYWDNGTLTAQWKIKTYTVTFDLAGGSASGVPLAQTVEHGSPATAPSPVKKWHTFTGWSTDFSSVKSNLTVTALWKIDSLTSDQVYEKCKVSTVEIKAYDQRGNYIGLGSGFILSSDGQIVTNLHVAAGASRIVVYLHDKTEYEVTSILGYSDAYDLAILKINAVNLPAADIWNEAVENGDTVYAIGSPNGNTGTITQGTVVKYNYKHENVEFIHSNAHMDHGNSGGPLINKFGYVIGVNTFIDNEGGSYSSNIGYLNSVTRKTYSMDAFASETVRFMVLRRETESNDTLGTAENLYNGSGVAGSIGKTGDIDYFVYPENNTKSVLIIVATRYEDRNKITMSYSAPYPYSVNTDYKTEDGIYYMYLTISANITLSKQNYKITSAPGVTMTQPVYYEIYIIW